MHHKIDRITVDEAEDLDIVMPMYNLIEYSSNYSETTGSLWFYSKDEATDFNADIANDNSFKSFKYKAKLLGNTKAQPNPNHANGILNNATIVVPLKYLSNVWRSLEMPLINFKAESKLKWTKYCVLSAGGNDDTNAHPNNVIFTTKDTKLYVPVVILSAKAKLSRLLSKRYKDQVFWNEYKTKSENKMNVNEYRCFLESN